jgi:hypothetical protein
MMTARRSCSVASRFARADSFSRRSRPQRSISHETPTPTKPTDRDEVPVSRESDPFERVMPEFASICGYASSRWMPRRARASFTRANATCRSRFSRNAPRINVCKVVSTIPHHGMFAYDESRRAWVVSRQPFGTGTVAGRV